MRLFLLSSIDSAQPGHRLKMRVLLQRLRASPALLAKFTTPIHGSTSTASRASTMPSIASVTKPRSMSNAQGAILQLTVAVGADADRKSTFVMQPTTHSLLPMVYDDDHAESGESDGGNPSDGSGVEDSDDEAPPPPPSAPAPLAELVLPVLAVIAEPMHEMVVPSIVAQSSDTSAPSYEMALAIVSAGGSSPAILATNLVIPAHSVDIDLLKTLGPSLSPVILPFVPSSPPPPIMPALSPPPLALVQRAPLVAGNLHDITLTAVVADTKLKSSGSATNYACM